MMKRLSNAVVLLAATAMLWGCGNKNKRPDSELVTDKDPVKSYLASIPADTPYAFVALEPMPLAPMLGWAEKYSESLKDVMPDYDELLQDEYLDSGTKVVYAILSELDGNYTPERLQELGFSASPRFALYGIGVLPAIRMDLGDVEAFKAMVGRVEKKAGLERTVETLGETEFWSYMSKDGDFTILSVQDKEVMFGFAPAGAEELYTPYLIGEEFPDDSLADGGVLSGIADKHGFQPYGVGFVDVRRIGQMFIDPEPGLNDETLRITGAEFPDVTEACRTESYELLDATPRVVFGYEDWSMEHARVGWGVEVTNDLGKEMLAAQTTTPVVGSDFGRAAPILVAFGFDVGKIIDIVTNRAVEVRNNPYQCEWFRELNGIASEVSSISAGVPALLRNLRGGAAVVNGLRASNPSGATPQPSGPTGAPLAGMQWKVQGMAMLKSADAISLFDFIKSFVPELINFKPPTNGTATALPPIQGADMLDMPHVLLTTDTLVVASGDTATNSASSLTEANATERNPFLTVIYDLPKLAQIIEDSGAPGLPSLTDVMIGRTEFELEPREDGIFLHTSISFSSNR